MRQLTWLVLAAALAAPATEASAQQAKADRPQSGFLGIRYDESWIVINGKSDPAKVIVKDVSKDSPADKAGIRAGDEIVRINGLAAGNGKFSAVARTLVAGDTVVLRVKRGSQERDYTVVAAPRPAGYSMMRGDRHIIISADSVRERMKVYLDSARIHLDSMKLPRVWVTPGDSTFNIRIKRFGAFPDSSFFGNDSSAFNFDVLHRNFDGEFGPGMIFRSIELGQRAVAGAEFTELEPAMKPYFKTDRGILVLRVIPSTPAARAGLQAGDVVVKANDQPVDNVRQFRRLVAQPQKIKLDILRRGENRTLELERRSGSDE